MSRFSKARLYALLALLLGGLLLFNTPKVTALSAADWRAGNIIDDSMFFSPAQMSQEEIQAFLNNKMPVCDTQGTQPYGGTTRALYGESRGYPAPYTCLKDYLENPTTHENNANGGTFTGGWSAAQIIKYAADSYGINPKSLIVLLEKEQGLVTDDWPWTIQYRSATGYGCPDTAPCDAEYYGFYNQVMNAASQFKRYATYPSDYRYKAYQSNFIQYNPNIVCGGSNVSIVNQATAGLYNYTPYQPNPSALENLTGSGDACGAYGNRNFWRLHNEWFGDTHGAIYAASYDSVDNFIDNTKTVSTPATPIVSGTKTYMVLRFKNTGNVVWRKSGTGAVRLATLNSSNSLFCDSTWLSCQRPAEMKEDLVNPGEVATFEFWYKAPSVTSDTSFLTKFGLVSETVATMGGTPQWQTTLVQKPIYNASYNHVENYTDATKTSSTPASFLPSYKRTYMVLWFKNTGNTTWYRSGSGAIRLATLNSSSSPFCDTTWLSCQRPAEMKEDLVNPGEIATFEFWYKAPSVTSDTSFLTKFGLVSETVATMGGTPQWQTTLVQKP